MKRGTLLFTLLVLLTLSVSACAQPAATPAPAPTATAVPVIPTATPVPVVPTDTPAPAAPAIKRGGVLKIGFEADFECVSDSWRSGRARPGLPNPGLLPLGLATPQSARGFPAGALPTI